MVDFDHRKKKFLFKCEVLDNTIFDTIPKRIDLIPKEIYSSTRSQSPQSSPSDSIITRSKSKKHKRILSDDSSNQTSQIL